MKKLIGFLGAVLMFAACDNLDILDDLPKEVKDAMIYVDKTKLSIEQTGGTGVVNIETSSVNKWEVTCDKEWVVFTGATSGYGDGTISFSVGSNSGKTRFATIRIDGDTGVRHSLQKINVSQDGVKSEEE